MIADITEGIITLLKADSDVTNLVSTRVYGFELPQITMPQKAIVVEPSGGVRTVEGYAEIEFPRVDIRCYGETVYEANKVYRTVHDVLKQAKRVVHSSVLIHSLTATGGFVLTRADETEWARIVASYQVMHSELAAA